MSVIDIFQASKMTFTCSRLKAFKSLYLDNSGQITNSSSSSPELLINYQLKEFKLRLPDGLLSIKIVNDLDTISSPAAVLTRSSISQQENETGYIVSLFGAIYMSGFKNLGLISNRTVSKSFLRQFGIDRATGKLFIMNFDHYYQILKGLNSPTEIFDANMLTEAERT